MLALEIVIFVKSIFVVVGFVNSIKVMVTAAVISVLDIAVAYLMRA